MKILLRALRKMNSPERQIYNSAGPCLRHRKLQILKINSDQGQISNNM